jgi:hypothetical protein
MPRKQVPPPRNKSDDVLVRYQRRGDVLRLTLRQNTNHELREVLVGLWARLEPADRRDHLRELTHYAEYLDAPERYPDRSLSPIAEAIRRGPDGDSAIDLLSPRGTSS